MTSFICFAFGSALIFLSGCSYAAFFEEYRSGKPKTQVRAALFLWAISASASAFFFFLMGRTWQ